MMLPIVGAIERKRQEGVERRVAEQKAKTAAVWNRALDEVFPDRPQDPPAAG
jgi:hypothetical protein